MIKRIVIESFKSIVSLPLDCNRINVFIGPPNTGKSNILEALGYLSYYLSPKISERIQLNNFVRYMHLSDLYYDNDVSKPIIINFDDYRININYDNLKDPSLFKLGKKIPLVSYSGPKFRYYKFNGNENESIDFKDFLLPPYGANLFYLLLTHKNLREIVQNFFNPFNLTLGLRQYEAKIEVNKIIDNIIISYPYKNISETLKRLVLYTIAIETNTNAIIIFEEPEIHTFPYYTKFFAERIAIDQEKNNQYFFSTHNPYLLIPLLEKTKEVNVFATKWENYQTKVYLLNNENILKYESDVFFNLDKLIEANNE